jgi:signal transduction histidine kinase
MVYISVTDNGCGIPKEHLPNVTKKFYKANYLKRGSGIGLAIVDEIVSLHGGKLDIISEEGFGTTVTVNLPVASDSGAAPVKNHE